jgi:hypothetical protein
MRTIGAVVALFLLLGLLLGLPAAGCTPIQPAAQSAMPMPVEIRIVVPGSQRTLTAQDARFTAIAADLAAALPSISTQARTFFDAMRFSQEIAPIPHIMVVYSSDTDFSGQGIAWRAVELVVVAPEGETMLLARANGVDDWSVYLADDPARLTDFLNTHAAP